MHTPEQILEQYWGFSAFRPMQRDIIQSALDGRDTLALLPTGGGKSLCFQVPALCREGITVVVSPLIALMRDQVQQLKSRNITAEAIYSGMSYREIDRILDNAVFGGYKLLYLSPERLLTELAQERIKRMNVNFIAIDEAHCISQWGYDFRPPYLQIAAIRGLFPDVPVIALTATATPEVVKDMQEKLAFKPNKQVFIQDFNRPNLAYIVRNTEAKEAKMLEIFQKVQGSAVVYVRSRKKAAQIALWLQRYQISADFYHAGLDAATRGRKQDDWLDDRTRIIVATNAFGMGIDKPNVRVVVHYDTPDAPEAYFQEAGRAGRDGKKSYAVLLHAPHDRAQLEESLRVSFPEMPLIRRVYQALGSYFQLATGSLPAEGLDFDLVAFCKRFNFELLPTYAAFRILEQDGWVSLSEAIYVPPTMQVVVEKEDLYDFQLKKPIYDRVIKGILRALSGVMQSPTSFNMFELARFMKMSVIDLEATLLQLHQENIIVFRPSRDQPQLTFLRERIDADLLTIDWARYHFRKKRQIERTSNILDYAEIRQCRSQQLLRYFGQTDAQSCGVCDVCLEPDTNVPLETTDVERYVFKIKHLLSREKLTIRELLDSFSERHRPYVLQVTTQLLDSGVLGKQHEKIVVL